MDVSNSWWPWPLAGQPGAKPGLFLHPAFHHPGGQWLCWGLSCSGRKPGAERGEAAVNVLKTDLICFLIKVTLPSACQVHWSLTSGYDSLQGWRGGAGGLPALTGAISRVEGVRATVVHWALRDKRCGPRLCSSLARDVDFGQAPCCLFEEAVRSDTLLKVEELPL